MASRGVRLIRIKAFAQVREVTGEEEFTLSLETPTTTVADIKKMLCERSSHWREALDAGVLCAVEQTICDDTALVADGNEVAFFPPVTGG